MTLQEYIDNLDKRYRLGNATEHTFRGDLQQLLESLVPTIRATNEPKRQSCGAPDYILTKKDIPVGFIEAKDIGDKDLDGTKKTGNKEQFDRYKASLNNLIFTDYINFHLYREGEFITKISIGELFPSSEGGVSAGRGSIKPLPENFGNFENLIKDFCVHVGQTIKSSKKLAEMMAGKARLLSDIIEKSLTSDEENQENSTLKEQMLAFKQILIHDITPQGFADVYAQTIAYGMFAARLHDPTLDNFSRQEAAELIPKSNPFLRKLFGYIAGPDIDDRIKWVVENLSEIFLACNVEEILKNYGKSTKMEDPIIHFYETFLSEYDPKLRKSRGVWYTPQPVVNFIVRAVDDILKTEFDLPQGLADTSKTTIKVNTQTADKRSTTGYKQQEIETHRVQILDPATGTGTFLAEVVKHIHKKFQGQQGIWSNYVETHLLPRLNGFELLMASYAMAHLKLDLLLKETGYNNSLPSGGVPAGRGGNQRLRVYLTNSLEEHHQDTGTLFANWLSTEANEANHIKRDTPVMCVIGNPPYSGESANKGEWIMSLMDDYKKEPGGKEKLKERNPKWINDDYVKFLRYGQHFIEKNGSGVLAFINPHGFLDNPTFRGMRWHLLKTYDKIYTIDLHGNSKKKETAPDGSADTNVFDIQQGVSINVFVKTGKKKPSELGKVFHYDLYGKRDFKYDFLNENSIQTIGFNELPNVAPMYLMVLKDFEAKVTYDKGFSVNDLFLINGVGLTTAHDEFVIRESKTELLDFYKKFQASPRNDEFLHKEFNVRKKTGWDILQGYDNIKNETDLSKYIEPISYRPFDNRYVFYEDKLVWRTVRKVMQHLINGDNIGLVSARSNKSETCDHFYISKNIMETKCGERTTQSAIFPLYLYPETNGQQSIDQSDTSPSSVQGRTPNLNPDIVKEIAEQLGLTFTNEKFPSSGGVAESRGGKKGRRNTQNYMNLPYNPKLKGRARELRQAGNLSEVLFWNQVKNKQFKGFDFDRQKIVGNYIVDFFCTNCNVVIEIDGSSHDNKVEYDAERDSFLEGLGLTVIHIPVKEVMNNMSGVIQMLIDHPALKGTPPKEGNVAPINEENSTFAPIDILDYIYAVLHSPSYREKYKEFLKIDFPRVPYPKDKNTFWQLVELGGEIRQIHLLESPKVDQYITQYPIDGDNVVGKPKYKDGKVYINDTQYFDNVPQTAWEFYIGGYQPAQKWLKDRKDRKLEFDDILHYQKIIVALSETDRLMKEIDKINIE
ncbi:type ISP restriction/modification enzyme [Maribacter sp. 4G9]|uniref:type ISP restriction/modification enzyme n=1 Tax=Maribacter sp. 4G9 TaxID=1889777 RepID=UPI001F0A9F3B|nr:type ISP restriction/modification enzyme [Maribacter sp. 4G9]